MNRHKSRTTCRSNKALLLCNLEIQFGKSFQLAIIASLKFIQRKLHSGLQSQMDHTMWSNGDLLWDCCGLQPLIWKKNALPCLEATYFNIQINIWCAFMLTLAGYFLSNDSLVGREKRQSRKSDYSYYPPKISGKWYILSHSIPSSPARLAEILVCNRFLK